MRIRPDIVKLYKAVHSWTGLLCGLLLFIAFYAGALTMFSAPIARWAAPPRATASLADALALMDRILSTRPEAREELNLYVGDSPAEPRFYWWDPEDGRQYVADLGADGRLVIGPPSGSRLARSIDLIHRAGGLPIDRDTSLRIMGVIALLYFVAILSGLILVLRSLARDLFALRVGRNLKRMWLDAHNAVGIVSLPFHLFIAISTAVFAFDGDILDLQDRVIYQGRLDEIVDAATPVAAEAPRGGDGAMLPPGALIQRVRAISPASRRRRSPMSSPAGPARSRSSAAAIPPIFPPATPMSSWTPRPGAFSTTARCRAGAVPGTPCRRASARCISARSAGRRCAGSISCSAWRAPSSSIRATCSGWRAGGSGPGAGRRPAGRRG